MKPLHYDIDGRLIITKKKPSTPKIKKSKINYRTLMNIQVKKFITELEQKLPNEFKGSIINFNHYNTLDYCNIDENEYNFL